MSGEHEPTKQGLRLGKIYCLTMTWTRDSLDFAGLATPSNYDSTESSRLQTSSDAWIPSAVNGLGLGKLEMGRQNWRTPCPVSRNRIAQQLLQPGSPAMGGGAAGEERQAFSQDDAREAIPKMHDVILASAIGMPTVIGMQLANTSKPGAPPRPD